jgi:hypothetical protein
MSDNNHWGHKRLGTETCEVRNRKNVAGKRKSVHMKEMLTGGQKINETHPNRTIDG